MDKVRDALLVAAGIGTRMFPVSASVPKESLPLLDVPLLTHLILEAKHAGVERLHIITSPSKSCDVLLDDRRQHAGALFQRLPPLAMRLATAAAFFIGCSPDVS